MDTSQPQDPVPDNISPKLALGQNELGRDFLSGLDRNQFAFSFAGNTSEYFRIWIVNVALTVATLGVYAAWAKVRTRRYFYANTLLDGHSFDYVAKPTAILTGNIIIFSAAAALYLSFEGILPNSVFIFVVLGGLLVFPYLVFKSIRFKARNSMYRNVRFRFRGTIGEAYKVYLGWAALCGLIGLCYPFWAHRKKQYVYGRMSFGGKAFRFFGDSGKFFAFYFYAVLMGLGLLVPILILEGMIFGDEVNVLGGGYSWQAQIREFASLAVFWGAYVFLQQFVYGKITKYSFESTELLGDFRFRNTINAWRLAWISFSNLLFAIGTFGLLIPWGRVRRARYLVENLTLETRSSELNSYVEESGREDQALGDSAVDIMDFEVGW